MKNTIYKSFMYKDILNIYGVLSKDGNTKNRTTIKWYLIGGDSPQLIGTTTTTVVGMSHYLDCAMKLTQLAYISSFTDGENGPTATYIANKLAKKILD